MSSIDFSKLSISEIAYLQQHSDNQLKTEASSYLDALQRSYIFQRNYELVRQNEVKNAT